METKEIKITPPDGYEIDQENSTFECIKFKKIEKKAWRYDEDKKVNGFIINVDSEIHEAHDLWNVSSAYRTFATEKQAKSALAMARISQIMANDERFGGVVTYEEWNNPSIKKYVFYRYKNNVDVSNFCATYHYLAFHTEKQRNLFLKENEDLIRDYLML